MRRYVLLAVLVTGIAEAPVAAQDPGSRQTREFVQAAGESDTFEIMEAYTVLSESNDPLVRAFATQMIHDHGETSRKLAEATARTGLKPPPMAVGAAQAPFLAALQSQHGRNIDKVYWQQQVLAHRSALILEQQYASSGDTPAIMRAAAAAIPMIQSHLAMAEQRSAKLAGGS